MKAKRNEEFKIELEEAASGGYEWLVVPGEFYEEQYKEYIKSDEPKGVLGSPAKVVFTLKSLLDTTFTVKLIHKRPFETIAQEEKEIKVNE